MAQQKNQTGLTWRWKVAGWAVVGGALYLAITSRTFWVCAALMLVATILVVVVAVAASTVSDRRAEAKAISKVSHRTIFVYTRKRGWNEVVVNNVLPLLPHDQVRILVRQSLRDPENYALYRLVERHRWASKRRGPMPFLITLPDGHKGQANIVELHQCLLPSKPLGKRSAATKATIRQIVERALGEQGIVLSLAQESLSTDRVSSDVDGRTASELD